VTVPSRFLVGGVTVGLVSGDLLAAGAGNMLDQMFAVVVDAQGGLVDPEPAQFMHQPARAPAGMGPTQLTHPRLNLCGQLTRMAMRAMRPIG